jgi:hypothetical protein
MDETYFLDILRRREREIADEVERLRDASRSNRVGAEDVDRLAARLESVGSDLNDVRGFLADENLVLDVLVGAGMDPARALDELRERHETIRARNDAERRRVDAACGERKTSQTATEDLERQIATRREELKTRVENLPADRRREHETLESERGALAEAQAELEAELADVTDQGVAAERELAEDATRRRALALRDKLEASEAERDRVAREVEKLRLSPEDQRARLKEQIREDNAETAELEREAQQLQKQARALERSSETRGRTRRGGIVPAEPPASGIRRRRRRRRARISSRSSSRRRRSSWTSSRTSSPSATASPRTWRRGKPPWWRSWSASRGASRRSRRRRRREETAKTAKTANGENGGGGDAGDSTRDALSELEFKRRQTENASTTNDRLRAEKELRREELEKVDALESKITAGAPIAGEPRRGREAFARVARRARRRQARGGGVREGARGGRANVRRASGGASGQGGGDAAEEGREAGAARIQRGASKVGRGGGAREGRHLARERRGGVRAGARGGGRRGGARGEPRGARGGDERRAQAEGEGGVMAGRHRRETERARRFE